MKIAVVGAQGTGKSTLVAALQCALQADTQPIACTVVEGWKLEQQPSYDLTLLMGLDLPNGSDPKYRQTAEQYDSQLRELMGQHAMTYAVVYGIGHARTDSALQAIGYHLQKISARRSPASTSTWQWCCDTCSDAACEHGLFTALVNKQAGSVRT